MKRLIFTLTLLIALFAGSVMVFADAATEIKRNELSHAVNKSIITTPFSLADIENRSVNPATGNMETKITDISLKGINGLDFNLARYYSLQQSSLFDFYIKPVVVNGQITQTLDRNTTTVNEKMYDIGAGWAFDLPYLLFNDDHTQVRELHNGSEGVLFVELDSSSSYNQLLDCFVFQGNNLHDILLRVDTTHSFNNGQSDQYIAQSWWYMEKKDGQRYYFNYYGNLIGISDRFGNKITFKYAAHSEGYRINQVIDSVGRLIDFNYDDTNHKLTVTVSGDGKTQTVCYQKQRIRDKVSDAYKLLIDDTEYYLDTVTDLENRVTTYGYTFIHCKADMDTKYVTAVYDDGTGLNNFSACLTTVIYPSGGKSVFVNKVFTKNLGSTGSMQFYKLSTSTDIAFSSSYSNASLTKTYSYKCNNSFEYDGWPSVPSGTISDVMTTYSTGLSNTDRYVFDYKLLCTGITNTGPDQKNVTTNEYDNDGQLTKATNQTYNQATGQYIEKIENYSYNDYRDLLGYWNSRAEGNINNTEYKTTYQYNPVYHFLTSKTYKKDANTTITEEYTASADNKTVDYYRVKENGTLKKQVQYLYDTYGNITEERNYLDNWTACIATKYSYTDNVTSRNGQFNGLYLTRKYVEGVTDVDGTLVAARGGNNAGTVDENFTYDWFGNLIQKKDAAGNTNSYEYDKLGRMTKQTNPDSTFKTWLYTTNSSENSVLLTDEDGAQIKYGYDKLGNLIFEQDMTSDQYLNQYKYGADMRLLEENNHNTSPNSRKITYTYTSDGRLKTKVTKNKSGTEISQEAYSYDDAYVDTVTGNKYSKITKTIDLTTYKIITNTYVNKYGLVEKVGRMHNSAEYIDTFKYDYLGNKIEEKSSRAYNESWTQPWTAKYEYNYAGKLTKQYNINGDYSTTGYDALGRVTSVTDIKGNKSNPVYSTTYTYDNMGRVLQEKVPFESSGGTIYYSTQKHYYDRNGNISIEKTTNNKPGEAESFSQTSYEYNSRNMLVKATTYNNITPANYTQYYYDAAGNKLRMYTGLSSPITINGLDNITPGSDNDYSVTKYEYNQFGKLTKMTDPLGQSENYTYDLDNDLTQKTDRNGNISTMTYDGLGKALTTSVTTPGGTGNAAYTYTYLKTGSRATMTGGGINTTYTYDDLGRLITETESNGTVKEYTYDADNNRKSLVIKQSGVVKTNTTYTYDTMNRLYQVFENGLLTATYTYDANSNRASLAYPNGDTAEYQYNPANKLTLLANKKGANILSQYAYTYYLNGSQESKTDLAGKTSYIYDGLERLSNVSEPGGITTAYTYDDYSNRSTMAVAGGASPYTVAYAYDKNSRLNTETHSTNGVTNYGYDNNGNQTSKGASTYKYDGYNQLTQSVDGGITSTYAYNGDGLRRSKTVNGVKTTHVWDGSQIALELDSAGSVTGKYIRGINLIAAEDGAGVRKYYLFNGHGDVVELANTTGDAVKSYDYDAFGVEKNLDSNDANVFRYCGEYWDKETGTYYLRARYYNPSVGRFITEDSVWGKDADPLSLNLYTYCSNNPIMFFDPSGHTTQGEAMDLANAAKNVHNAWIINATISAPTPEYNRRMDGSNAASYLPVISVVNNLNIAITGKDIQGFNVSDGDRQRAKDGIVFDAGFTIMGGAAEKGMLEGAVKTINPNEIKFSQSSVNGAEEIIQSMRASGWNGPPIDVVKMPDGTLITIDNTRLLSAKYAGIDVKAVVRDASEALPQNFIERFTTKNGGIPQTWGDAIRNRIGSQNAAYRNTYLNGLNITGWDGR